VQLARTDGQLVVDVVDDGVGLPPGFTVEQSSGLGLSIVHTLVTSELGGTIELRSDHGTRVHLTVPLKPTVTTAI
jgi:two-component system, sensor histidine kinase PdtaS